MYDQHTVYAQLYVIFYLVSNWTDGTVRSPVNRVREINVRWAIVHLF